MSENIDYGDEDLTPIIEGERAPVDETEDFKNAGYREATSVEELNDEMDMLEIFEDTDSDAMDGLDD